MSRPVHVCWKYEPRAKKRESDLLKFVKKRHFQKLPKGSLEKILPACNRAVLWSPGGQAKSGDYSDASTSSVTEKLLKENDIPGLNRPQQETRSMVTPPYSLKVGHNLNRRTGHLYWCLVSGVTMISSLVGLRSTPCLTVHGKRVSWWLSWAQGCFGPSGPLSKTTHRFGSCFL